MSKARILVVDDEPKVVRLVREVLTAAGYEAFGTYHSNHAIEMVAIEQPDLVILDILLAGDEDGFALAARIREFKDVPIIFLTGKVREVDMLRGFEIGADDYITKPFSAKELLARVGAVLRRARKDASAQPVEIVCGALRIDLARRVVFLNGRSVHLTPTEYSLLHEMVIHRNQVLVHEHLLTAVWGSEYRDDVDYLRAYIHHLRGKIEKDPANPQVIIRCPGVGYMLVCPEGSQTPTEKPNPFE